MARPSIDRSSDHLPLDILILSNGPGEITTWVRPVVKALRQQLGEDRQQVRISLILSPCPNASGSEAAIAQTYPEIDRIQSADRFFPFLLWGQTAEPWDWRKQGVTLFLGGDQIFTVIIGKRLGYRTVVYGEWETRWHRWIDRFGVMKPELIERVQSQHAHKFSVVGDLMADIEAGDSTQDLSERMSEKSKLLSDPPPKSPIRGDFEGGLMQKSPRMGGWGASARIFDTSQTSSEAKEEIIGILPGSKGAKLAQGLPLGLAIAHSIYGDRPQTRFVIPVAPTLHLSTLAKFADPAQNPLIEHFGNFSADLIQDQGQPFLQIKKEGQPTPVRIELYTQSPAYPLLIKCRFCLTTVGANTAELGALAVPMIVLLPTQQLDAMRSWDGIPGLLANLPGVGTLFARLINRWFLRKTRLLAWPNIWAGKMIVPELVGHLIPQDLAELAIDWLDHPEKLTYIQTQLRQVRGDRGAAQKLAQLVVDCLK
ncbi:MAG: lipid-A-disaccharide synthase [Timaviella obliquedivisa GSE-PSE-MK23-08B]|jgi:lipid-A-disaccharide synthase|nr:lipid-A-disaccharide synthase [Timaviella obliquedivisa GSE-PSE-MK23-08B]